MWVSEGLITDPGDDELLADTGPLMMGTFSFVILGWSDVGGQLTLHQRNAANNGDVHTQRLSLTTSDSAFHQIVTVPIMIPSVNQRITLTLDHGFTGTIQCSILG